MSPPTQRDTRPNVLFPEDVAGIWTQEARADVARKVIKKLYGRVREAADMLPDVSLRTPPSEVDQAVTDLKAELPTWTAADITVDMGEAALEGIVTSIRDQVRRTRQRFDALHAGNPHVKAARRELDAIDKLIEREWDGRKRPEISKTTVWSYLEKSKPGGRYADPSRPPGPVPTPEASRGTHRPMWFAEQEQALRNWWRAKPGPGAGGGRPRKHKPEHPTQ